MKDKGLHTGVEKPRMDMENWDLTETLLTAVGLDMYPGGCQLY
jgi:hypothetical protein